MQSSILAAAKPALSDILQNRRLGMRDTKVMQLALVNYHYFI
jgi:hypothetical protein